MMENFWKRIAVISCCMLLGLAGAACGGDEGPDGSGGNGNGGNGGEGKGNGGNGDGDGEGDGNTNNTNSSGPGLGNQGFFATIDGVERKANIGKTNGFFSNVQANYQKVTLAAKEDVDGELVDWSLWVPNAVGTYDCGLHTDIGKAHLSIDTPKGKPGMEINTGGSAGTCTLSVDKFDVEGIISGTFSGTMSNKEVVDGRFYVDNQRGGGDCSKASDPGIGPGNFGATASIVRLENSDPHGHFPPYLRCGQNFVFEKATAGGEVQEREDIGSGQPKVGVLNFSSEKVFYNFVDVSVSIQGLNKNLNPDQYGNTRCEKLFFNGWRTEKFQTGSAETFCEVVIDHHDEKVWEGSYRTVLGRSTSDPSVIEIEGSFRVPAPAQN